jgi:opacity protein-like surface antigen
MQKVARSLLVVLVCGLTSTAMADAGKWRLALAPGYAVPVGPTGDYLKGSASVDASAMYDLRDWVSVGLELGYIFSSKLEGTVPGRVVGDVDGDGVEDPISFTSDIHSSVLHVTPQIEIGPTFKREGSNMTVHPYGVIGGGYYRTHVEDGTLTLTGTTSGGLSLTDTAGTSDSITDTNGGLNLGGGIDFGLTETFRMGVDVRYHRIFYSEGDDTEFVIPALRLSFLF